MNPFRSVVRTAVRTVLVFADIALNAAAGPVKLPAEHVALGEDRVRAVVRDEIAVLGTDLLSQIEPQFEAAGVFADPVYGPTFRKLFDRK